MNKILILSALVLAGLLRADGIDAEHLKRAELGLRQLFFGKAILREAEKHLGEPYVWGGKDEAKDGGLDCSGFSQTVYKAFGIELPPTALGQFQKGTPIEKEALNPGDLVFFLSSSAETPMHVGIYAGDDQFIHAPGEGKKIQLSPFSTGPLFKRYAGARRFDAPNPRATPTPSPTQETQP